MVEDDPADAELMVHELRDSGFAVEWNRVESTDDFPAQLETDPDVILVDNSLPQFGAAAALRLLKESHSDLPLIVVSGTLVDEAAVELVRQGASDYVLKDRLARLGEAVAIALERRRMRGEIRAQADLLRLLGDQAPGVVWTTDAGLRCTFAGGRDHDLLGAEERDPPIGRWMPELLGSADDSTAAARVAHDEALAGNSGSFELTWGDRVFQCQVEPLREGDDVVTGVVGTANDVTERTVAEAALLEAQARYRTLVEQIPAITYVDEIGSDGTVDHTEYVSPQIESMFGYAPSEWMADPTLWKRTIHPDDRGLALARDVRHYTTGEPLDQEYRVIARDGREIWVRDMARILTDAQGRPRGSQGVLFDVTAERRAMEALEDRERRIRRLLEGLVRAQESERARIAGDIHDDTIQHMTAVGLRLQVYRNRVRDSKDQEALDLLLDQVQASIGRMRNLLFELRPRTLDEQGLSAALKELLDRLEGEFEGRLDSRLTSEPSLEVGAILYRIVQEAVANVRKHAGATRVDIVLEHREGGCHVSIRDNGRGFDTQSALRPRPGHLGLASMLERAEMAGGWCQIQSVRDEGATVEAWLPEP